MQFQQNVFNKLSFRVVLQPAFSQSLVKISYCTKFKSRTKFCYTKSTCKSFIPNYLNLYWLIATVRAVLQQKYTIEFFWTLGQAFQTLGRAFASLLRLQMLSVGKVRLRVLKQIIGAWVFCQRKFLDCGNHHTFIWI